MNLLGDFIHTAIHAAAHEALHKYGHPHHQYMSSRRDFVLLGNPYYDKQCELITLMRNQQQIPEELYNFFPNFVLDLCKERNCLHLIDNINHKEE